MLPMGYEADLKLFIDGSWRAGEDRDHFTINAYRLAGPSGSNNLTDDF